MTDMRFAPASDDALRLFLIDAERFDDWHAGLEDAARAWVALHGFTAKPREVLIVPDHLGQPSMAAVGLGDARARARSRFDLGGARDRLPRRRFRLVRSYTEADPGEQALGWLLAGYRFDAYRSSDARDLAGLIAPEGVDAARIEAIAAGEVLSRDLINTPANDMGPAELEVAAETLAHDFDAAISVIRGGQLIDANLPLIHTVGASSERAPRLIDMRWGETGPKLTVVGKGVCFDTGGLNLKPGASMALMKKDMGGAATVLGLARMIMALDLPVRLRVLIPAVENAVSDRAMRPGDIYTARNGMTVEINNTDAEGRLVLADALTLAAEEAPDLLVSMATLTGAARVAVGPDLAPYFTDDDGLSDRLSAAGRAVADPVWRLPLWAPYEPMIEPAAADLDNAPKGGFAGAITAALFLRRFAGDRRYVHFDIYGWQPSAAPARPVGGVGQGARALLEALPGVLGLE